MRGLLLIVAAVIVWLAFFSKKSAGQTDTVNYVPGSDQVPNELADVQIGAPAPAQDYATAALQAYLPGVTIVGNVPADFWLNDGLMYDGVPVPIKGPRDDSGGS